MPMEEEQNNVSYLHDILRGMKVDGEFLDKGSPTQVAELPKSIDWRQLGAVTSVKRQMQAVGAIEGMHQIRTGQLIDLSVQQVVNCSDTPSMRGVFKYVQQNGGIAAASMYPYVGNRGECDTRRAAQIAVSIDGYTKMTWRKESDLMQKVAKGPVSCGISITREFNSYTGGVLKASDSNILNHAVLCVGYGTNEAEGDYWIIKNSWGTGWGENGYTRIQRGVPFAEGPFGLTKLMIFPYLRRPSSETVYTTSTGSSKKRKRDTKFEE